jgi:3-oxoisoapionate kinase
MTLLTYYGDDFTGSTDVMEALASHGVETVLFTRLPTPEEFAPFANHAAIGLAGTSRSQSPGWMDNNLPACFTFLKAQGARFCHYKVCSTFDSSATVGNIGRAIEIGAGLFEQAMVPLVVGAPQLKRYTFAGHLFAGYQGETWRIDRHPVMSKHPVTPMHESDLRLHLSEQTRMLVTLANKDWPESDIALLDVHDLETQHAAGRRLLEWKGGFLAGSSGVEYALVKAWAESKQIAGHATFAPLQAVPQVIVVSGSVSPTTERQIRFAMQNGFQSVAVDPLALAVIDNESTIANAIAAALDVLNNGASPLVHTALGHATDAGKNLNDITDGRRRVGEGLGKIMRALVQHTQLRRIILAGGDSSSHALGQLHIHALKTRMPLPATPGSPFCTASSNVSAFDNIELALKGGQVGDDDYFAKLRDGKV